MYTCIFNSSNSPSFEGKHSHDLLVDHTQLRQHSQGSTPYIPDLVNPELLSFETALHYLLFIYLSISTFSQQQYRYYILFNSSSSPELRTTSRISNETEAISYPLPCQKALESEWKLGLQRTRGDRSSSLPEHSSIATDHRDSFAFLDLFPSLGDTGIWHYCW